MGNDFRDEPLAEAVSRFVVVPHAAEAFKQHMAGRYGAKVRTPSVNDLYGALVWD